MEGHYDRTCDLKFPESTKTRIVNRIASGRSHLRHSTIRARGNMLVITNRIKIPLRELRFSFARSSGPGGQNVNKLNTKATLRWSVSGSPSLSNAVSERFVVKYRRRITKDGDLVISSQRFRDRGRNVADCLGKLRDMVASVATTPPKRKATSRSRAANARRRRDKEALSRTKKLRQKPSSDD